jgi:tripartite-type tricarboxylate transporter receptor subunit TctC
MNARTRVRQRLLLAVYIVMAATEGRAQDATATFFNGRQLTITVGVGPGGPVSLYSQLVARHLGRHIAGAPTVIVQHMPGAGGLLAANTAYNTMPRDGSALVSTNNAILMEPLLGGKGAQFDAPKFTWIGGSHVEHMLCVTWHTSPITTLADAMMRPTVIGSYGADGPSAVFAKAANTFAGTKFSVITGYSSGPDALIAMQRSEVDGFCAMGWHELKRQGGWLSEKKVNILFQMGLQKDKELADVPLLLDHAKTLLDREVMELLYSPLAIGRPLYAPPGVPADRVQVLRSALERTLRDPRLLVEAENAGLPIRHVPGESVEKLIGAIYSAPIHLRERALAVSK